MAGVPGGHDVDRARHGHAVHRAHSHPREDVRVAPLLRRQARRHGRDASCCAIRTARSSSGPSRLRGEHGRVAGHSRRHGDARSPRCAPKGESTINNVGQIERGYERIDERLRALGARRSSAWRSAARGECRRRCRMVDVRRRPERSSSRRGDSVSAPSPRRAPSGSFGLHDRRAGRVSSRRAGRRCVASFGRPAARLATAFQVHGADGAPVTVAVGRDWLRAGDADGHASRSGAPRMAVTVADCVPVFIAHPSGAIALLHSGWRGTAAPHRRARHRRSSSRWGFAAVRAARALRARRSAASATR